MDGYTTDRQTDNTTSKQGPEMLNKLPEAILLIVGQGIQSQFH